MEHAADHPPSSTPPRFLEGDTSCPCARARRLVARALGPGVRSPDGFTWRITRARDDGEVRLELYGPPRLYVRILDSSKPGLHALRMIDLYDDAGLTDLRAAVDDLAAEAAPARPAS